MDENEMIGSVLLDLLEELLSITEKTKDQLSPEDRERWDSISAACADFREGDDESE